MPKNLNRTHASLRRDYRTGALLEKQMKAHPMRQFADWFETAVSKKIPDPNAFVLATADSKAGPSARVLLMKGYGLRGITFFTNYDSAKGRQIQAQPWGEAVFFWNVLSRQVRLHGKIVRLSRKESADYFYSRPLLAQLAACVSEQSCGIADRADLEQKFEFFQSKLKGKKPVLPPQWGGYELRVTHVEFWQGRPNRLHDRIRYESASRGLWKKVRLQP